MGSAIAKAMNWVGHRNRVLASVPETLLGTDDSEVEDTQEITIVLADKKAINMTETPKLSVDFKNAFNELASVIQTGNLPLLVNSNTKSGSNHWLHALINRAMKSGRWQFLTNLPNG